MARLVRPNARRPAGPGSEVRGTGVHRRVPSSGRRQGSRRRPGRASVRELAAGAYVSQLDRRLPGALPAELPSRTWRARVAATRSRTLVPGPSRASLLRGASRSSSTARAGWSCRRACGSSRAWTTRPWWSDRGPPRAVVARRVGRLQRGDDLARCARGAPPGPGHLASHHMSLRDPDGPLVDGRRPMDEGHLPVMVEEVMAALSPRPGSFHVDATVGGGGHALRILEAATPDGRLLGLDADPRPSPGRRSACGPSATA